MEKWALIWVFFQLSNLFLSWWLLLICIFSRSNGRLLIWKVIIIHNFILVCLIDVETILNQTQWGPRYLFIGIMDVTDCIIWKALVLLWDFLFVFFFRLVRDHFCKTREDLVVFIWPIALVEIRFTFGNTYLWFIRFYSFNSQTNLCLLIDAVCKVKGFIIKAFLRLHDYLTKQFHLILGNSQ